mmetsp:Transcript_8442/g.11650  ORF Transcript_8442/g.11650 Transcript_8442/m.11650 type:complete len:597 (+) Transcript_8442:104-1894(+)
MAFLHRGPNIKVAPKIVSNTRISKTIRLKTQQTPAHQKHHNEGHYSSLYGYSTTFRTNFQIKQVVPTEHIIVRYSSTHNNNDKKPKDNSWWTWIKEGAHHYWIGSKLFALEMKTAAGILRRLFQGEKLIRRERKLLVTAFKDLLRLVPFSFFVIVPFAEFTLPIFLKIFPNMLPSTFEDKLQKEENLKKRLKARIELAKFMQDTVDEYLQEKKLKSQSKGLDFSTFMNNVKSGQHIQKDELVKFCTVFEDDLTMDNLPREQLVAMCKYMNLASFGNDFFLRLQLKKKLKQLKADDKLIASEGVDSLTTDELAAALRARGMRGNLVYTDEARARTMLKEWLEFSLDYNLPESVLIMSRAFIITERTDIAAADALQMALSSIPEEVVSDIKLKVAQDQTTPAQKLEVLKEETSKLHEEIEKAKVEEKAAPKPAPETPTKPAAPKKEEDVVKDFSEVAVKVLAYASPVEEEKKDLFELKLEREEEAPAKKEVEKQAVVEDALASRLKSKVDKMVESLEKDVEEAEKIVGSKLNIIDKDFDGVVSTEELREVLSVMKDKLTEEKFLQIINRLDADKDGKITVAELAKYAEESEKETNDKK